MDMKYIALFSIILVLGCTGTQPAGIKAGDKIAVNYTGSLEDGTIFDTSDGKGSLEFTAGAGEMISGFDAAVIGMRAGEEKNVTIAPEDAYGAYDQAATLDVPIYLLPNGTKVGDTLYSGTQSAVVLKINSTTATMDINHPLAGKTLIFKIRVVKIY